MNCRGFGGAYPHGLHPFLSVVVEGDVAQFVVCGLGFELVIANISGGSVISVGVKLSPKGFAQIQAH